MSSIPSVSLNQSSEYITGQLTEPAKNVGSRCLGKRRLKKERSAKKNHSLALAAQHLANYLQETSQHLPATRHGTVEQEAAFNILSRARKILNEQHGGGKIHASIQTLAPTIATIESGPTSVTAVTPKLPAPIESQKLFTDPKTTKQQTEHVLMSAKPLHLDSLDKNSTVPEIQFDNSFRTTASCYAKLKSYFPEVVLVAPQIPPNTGTIARMCAAFALRLHLVEPLGFSLSEKALRRAGLDYWENVDLHLHGSLAALDSVTLGRRWVFVETGGEVSPSDFQFETTDLLVLGSETKGIPRSWIDQLVCEGRGTVVTLPMYSSQVRSINLSCAASMVIFQATEQLRKKIK